MPRTTIGTWHIVPTPKMLTIIIINFMKKRQPWAWFFPTAHFGEGIIELDPWFWNLSEHQITWRI